MGRKKKATTVSLGDLGVELEEVDLADLEQDPRNARRHGPRGIGEIGDSLQAVGPGRSLVVRGRTIVVGNGTQEAALERGLRRGVRVKLPPGVFLVNDRSDLDERGAAEMGVRDNRSAEAPDTTWDVAGLNALMSEHALDAGRLGFTAAEMEALARAGDAERQIEQDEDDRGDLDEGGSVPDLPSPFPWFGGKARVGERVWRRLGEVENYVEPFLGSAAVLLACPYDVAVRTVNELDGCVCNFWRAVASQPDEVARWLDYPVSETDLFARHVWLVQRREDLVRQLEVDPDWCDPKAAGWWCWGQCAWIGGGWCSGDGPWTVEGGEVVHSGNPGQGVNRKLPHLGDPGQGVNRKLPHLGDPGRGVNRKLPHLGDPGQGVNRQLSDDGTTTKDSVRQWTEHSVEYMRALADKLRRVRVCCGDWSRVVTPAVTTRHGLTAVFLDPPYGEGDQSYAAGEDDATVAEAAWAWAREHGDDPMLRIAVCGYDDGRETPPGWSVMSWRARKGYQVGEKAEVNPVRERIWF